MNDILEQAQEIVEAEIMRQYKANPAWDEAKDAVENIDCKRIAAAILAIAEPNARIAALEAQLAEAHTNPSNDDDLQACEFCSKRVPIETCCDHGGVWICESCDAAWRKDFAECKHEWEDATNDMGDEGRVCTKCNGFVRLEDFADVVGSDPTRARSEQEGK